MKRKQQSLHLDDHGFDDVRVIGLEESGYRFAVTSLVRFLESRHRADIIVIAAFAVVLGACRWVSGEWGQVAISTMTYLFALFCIWNGNSNGDKTQAASQNDSGIASESQRETRGPERADRPKLLRSDPPSLSNVRSALDGVEEGQLTDNPQP